MNKVNSILACLTGLTDLVRVNHLTTEVNPILD